MSRSVPAFPRILGIALLGLLLAILGGDQPPADDLADRDYGGGY